MQRDDPMNPTVPPVPVLQFGILNTADATAAAAAAMADYWHALIPETEAAPFAHLDERTLQNYRQLGGGPPFVRVSARCIRYRRIDVKAWADARLRSSTADQGGMASLPENSTPGGNRGRRA